MESSQTIFRDLFSETNPLFHPSFVWQLSIHLRLLWHLNLLFEQEILLSSQSWENLHSQDTWLDAHIEDSYGQWFVWGDWSWWRVTPTISFYFQAPLLFPLYCGNASSLLRHTPCRKTFDLGQGRFPHCSSRSRWSHGHSCTPRCKRLPRCQVSIRLSKLALVTLILRVAFKFSLMYIRNFFILYSIRRLSQG